MRGKTGLFFCLAVLVTGANAQSGTVQPEDPFQTLRIDIAVTVTKHTTGADMVEITAESPDYPATELQSQAEAIGTNLGTPDRGLQVFQANSGSPSGSSFLKATFATNGILNGEDGIRLQAIARAFAGSQYPIQVHGLQIGLPDAKPLSNTLPGFDSDSVAVRGRTSPNPGIEYRVVLKTQDPNKVIIPDRLNVAAPSGPQNSNQGGVPITVVWVLTIVGAAAVGALVYNLALRGPRRTPRR